MIDNIKHFIEKKIITGRRFAPYSDYHKISCALLVLLILSTIFFLAYRLKEDYALTQSKEAVPKVLANSNQNTVSISSLPDLHLFGKVLPSLHDVPITNLQLRVAGITKVEHEAKNIVSKVYISIEGKPSKLFKVGDELPYGAKIYAIAKDEVILENDGRLEKLPLQRKQLRFKRPTSSGIAHNRA